MTGDDTPGSGTRNLTDLPVAIVGYGRMGRPMGRRLLTAGCRLITYDLDAAAVEIAHRDGAVGADSAAGAAAAAQVVITMLPDPTAVREAAEGAAGVLAGLRPGALWLEMSSSHPSTTSELAAAAAQREAELLDAPVSGGVAGAGDGTLTIMVGGASGTLERARPVLEMLGRVLHVGDRPGDGDLTKTLNNLLSAANLTAVAEALTVGIRAGLDPAALVAAVGSGSGASHALTAKIPTYVLTRSFDAGFTIEQMLKDLGIALEVASELEVPPAIGSLTHSLWASLASEGHAGDDHTMVPVLIAARAGVDLPAE